MRTKNRITVSTLPLLAYHQGMLPKEDAGYVPCVKLQLHIVSCNSMQLPFFLKTFVMWAFVQEKRYEVLVVLFCENLFIFCGFVVL